MRGIDLSVELPKKQNFLTESGEIEKLGFEGIVKICGVVCNFIDPDDELRFEGRAQAAKVLGRRRKFRGRKRARILDDPGAHLIRGSQAWTLVVSLFVPLGDTERRQ